MRRLTTLILVLQFLGFPALATVAFGEGAAARIMPPSLFCQRLNDALSSRLKYMALPEVNANQIGFWMIEEIRQGRITDYIPTSLPNNAIIPSSMSSNGYLSTEYILGSTLFGQNRSPRPGMLILSAAELKHIPFVQQGSSIILITNTTSPLDSERAKMVSETARRMGVSISVVWYGNSESIGLAFIASITGGVFVNLGGNANPCLIKS